MHQRDLSDFERGMIVGLHLAGKSGRDIEKILKIGKSTANRVISAYHESEKTTTAPRTGRPPILDERSTRQLVRTVKKNRKAAVEEITHEFASGLNISKPARQMVPSSLPPIIQEKCNQFVESFIARDTDSLPRKLTHNGAWKESNEELAEVASRILGTLNDAWNNPAFDPEFAELQSEGTYVNNVILPAIRATLKCLPLGKSTFVSSSERQSSASADRKGSGRLGRRPDIMFVMKHGEKNYELLYTECSRLTCTAQKEKNDEVKLWREANDGMYWTRKSCKPDKDEFGIIGVQVAGKKLRLSVLIRDMSE
ncbi:1767_t:CDS:2, partial [Paraglomus occultum]